VAERQLPKLNVAGSIPVSRSNTFSKHKGRTPKECGLRHCFRIAAYFRVSSTPFIAVIAGLAFCPTGSV
jgi:hypothetical protein